MQMRRVGWATMALSASLVSVYAVKVLLTPSFAPPFVAVLRARVPWAVVAHLAGALIALALGPWQLNARLRARAIHVHRWLGRGYVVSVVIGSVGALALARLSQDGFVTHVGFGLLASLWLTATLLGYLRIRARDQVSHRRWMVRSYALAFAAVTLRIYMPLAIVAGMSFHDAYQAVSWFCWVPNLVVADWIFLRRQGPDARQIR